MKLDTILTLAFSILTNCSAKKRDDFAPAYANSFSKNAMSYSERKHLLTEKIWHPENFESFLFEQKLNFDAKFMGLVDEDLEIEVTKYWGKVIERYAYGGAEGIRKLNEMPKRAIDRRIQLVLDDISVPHDKIQTRGRKALKGILFSIPNNSSSTIIISKYLESECKNEALVALSRTAEYISSILSTEEYLRLIELLKWSQKVYTPIPEYLFAQVLKVIE